MVINLKAFTYKTIYFSSTLMFSVSKLSGVSRAFAFSLFLMLDQAVDHNSIKPASICEH
jgi:hypothetical protein